MATIRFICASLLCAGTALAQTVGPNGYTLMPGGTGVVGNSTIQGNGTTFGPDDNGKYTISAEGIRMNFIPYGASASNLFINDTYGIERDVILGFDNASYYSLDRQHPYFGPVPGKYLSSSIPEC